MGPRSVGRGFPSRSPHLVFRGEPVVLYRCRSLAEKATCGVRPVPKRILSGVQPSGKLHLGNYFGAIQQHIALQDQGEAFYFIADYHALTTLKEAEAKEA